MHKSLDLKTLNDLEYVMYQCTKYITISEEVLESFLVGTIYPTQYVWAKH